MRTFVKLRPPPPPLYAFVCIGVHPPTPLGAYVINGRPLGALFHNFGRNVQLQINIFREKSNTPRLIANFTTWQYYTIQIIPTSSIVIQYIITYSLLVCDMKYRLCFQASLC